MIEWLKMTTFWSMIVTVGESWDIWGAVGEGEEGGVGMLQAGERGWFRGVGAGEEAEGVDGEGELWWEDWWCWLGRCVFAHWW